MSEEIKKETQDTELSLEEIVGVAGGDSFGIYDNSGTIVPCCIHCGKWFGSVADLNEHLKKEHS